MPRRSSSTACSHKPPGLRAARVLFIGNSFTEINGGIPAQLQGMAPSVQTDGVLVGGATLQDHLSAGAASQKILAGGWTYVVLQEQSQAAVTGESSLRPGRACVHPPDHAARKGSPNRR